jgi:peptidoglycan/xylan/chitin deacetylase (PgdA/CDA1 family)
VTRLTILMYHRVAAVPAGTNHPKNFVTPLRLREQIEGLLSWGYEPVSFGQWIHYSAHHGKVPRLPFIVTFDDGYADFDRSAWPILRALNVPATVFLVASKIGGTNDWDHHELRTDLLDAVRIRALETEGVEFGGHGYAHIPLARVSPNEARTDVEDCRAALVSLLAKPPEVFAYPYSNQNATVRRLVHQAGFHCAVRGKGRLNARWIDPFGLRRILMHEGITGRDLRRMLMRLRWLTLD